MTGAARAPVSTGSGRHFDRHASLAIAAVLACVFCFTGLSNHPLRAADEPRVAGIAWEMAHTGDVLVPRLGGEPFLEHPPLFYAALATTIRLFGSSDGIARLPVALGAAATLLLAFDLARRIAGPRAGILAILVLSSCQGFFKYSHKVMVDTWLAAAVTLGIWAYARAACEPAEGEAPPAHLVALLYTAAVMAFLIKGPVGVILLGGVVGTHALVARRWRFLRSWAHAPGLLLLIVGCAAWPIALYRFAGREIFDAFFWNNFVYRILPAEGVYEGGHEEAPWFYLVSLPAVVGGWIAVLPAFGAWVLRSTPPAGWNAPMLRFSAAVFPAGLVLLSAPATKRSLYLLPVLPTLAAAIGVWISSTRVTRGATRVERATVRAAAALMVGVAAVGRALALPAAALAQALGSPSAAGRLAAGAQRLLEGARREARGATPARAMAQFSAVAFGFAVFANVVLRPPGDPGRDLGPMAAGIVSLTADGHPLVAYELDEQMRGGLPFYTGVVLPNLHGVDSLRSYLRENPGARVLQGDHALGGFPESLPELRETHRWPTSEGIYRVYEVAAPGFAARPGEARSEPLP